MLDSKKILSYVGFAVASAMIIVFAISLGILAFAIAILIQFIDKFLKTVEEGGKRELER